MRAPPSSVLTMKPLQMGLGVQMGTRELVLLTVSQL